MISRRFFNTGLASVLALPAPKNLFTPALYQEQTKLLSCKLERYFPIFFSEDFTDSGKFFLTLKFRTNKTVDKELEFLGIDENVERNYENLPEKTISFHRKSKSVKFATAFKAFNHDTKEIINPNEISSGSYDIEIYDCFGNLTYTCNNFFLGSYKDLPNQDKDICFNVLTRNYSSWLYASRILKASL